MGQDTGEGAGRWRCGPQLRCLEQPACDHQPPQPRAVSEEQAEPAKRIDLQVRGCGILRKRMQRDEQQQSHRRNSSSSCRRGRAQWVRPPVRQTFLAVNLSRRSGGSVSGPSSTSTDWQSAIPMPITKQRWPLRLAMSAPMTGEIIPAVDTYT